MGSISRKALSTPGHSNERHSSVVKDARMGLMVLAGDAVLIRGCGRTDFEQRDARVLYQRVHERIFSLADETLLFPAHDYKGNLMSAVGEEQRFNPRLPTSVDELVMIMDSLNLAYPAQIDRVLPLNLVCACTSCCKPHHKAEPPVGPASPIVK
jgi:sulfur dioxygenase